MSSYTHLFNADISYIDHLYKQYKQEPSSLDQSWTKFFEGFDFAQQNLSSKQLPNTVFDSETIEKEVNVRALISGYRNRGHRLAKNNPLANYANQNPQDYHLSLEDFNLEETDLDKTFYAGHTIGLESGTLRQIRERLQQTYTGSIGYEFTAIRDAKILNWFCKKLEREFFEFQLSKQERLHLLDKLNKAVGFEQFLHTKYLGQKRFSLEGLEVLIPALDLLINEGIKYGLQEVFIGMAHRGRLNVLANIMGKPYEYIFAEFEGQAEMQDKMGGGDVKYHLGYASDFNSDQGEKILLNLASNPSHLEAVNTVVIGNVRARLDMSYGKNYDKIIPILIHGDAAVSGQGIVYETVQMSHLDAYQVGGTIHLILNNQVGFTTDVEQARSSLYSTDLSSLVEAPELHVNADDPEAVVFAIKLAVEFRQLYHRDVFIDLIGYRRYGHNESDEPRFTQPKIYNFIDKHKNVRDLYFEKLVKEGIVEVDYLTKITRNLYQTLDEKLKKIRGGKEALTFKLQRSDKPWRKMKRAKPENFDRSPITGICEDDFSKIAKILTTLPPNFKSLRQIDRLLKNRRRMLSDTKMLDWGTSENLAYGSLLLDGKHIRISGQDVERGTFSHRHAKFTDIVTNQAYYPLKNLGTKTRFKIYNSILSEYGVLGFEYGYASSSPQTLVVWEAQFGDFANGAQIIIDQFIASSETKWQRMCGLVLMLPHGFEGQGPEHSSARPERFLELCADYNMIVANVSTPANFFHLLRRQLTWQFRKPCIILTPKVLLRHPKCISSTSDFIGNTRFQEIYPDTLKQPHNKIEKILLCTGKLYYQLLEERKSKKHFQTAIIRIEQLHPFPLEQLKQLLAKYKNAKKLIWVQEEPVNMGYWTYLMRTYYNQNLEMELVARRPASAPDTGYSGKHKREQARIITAAFNR